MSTVDDNDKWETIKINLERQKMFVDMLKHFMTLSAVGIGFYATILEKLLIDKPPKLLVYGTFLTFLGAIGLMAYGMINFVLLGHGKQKEEVAAKEIAYTCSIGELLFIIGLLLTAISVAR